MTLHFTILKNVHNRNASKSYKRIIFLIKKFIVGTRAQYKYHKYSDGLHARLHALYCNTHFLSKRQTLAKFRDVSEPVSP